MSFSGTTEEVTILHNIHLRNFGAVFSLCQVNYNFTDFLKLLFCDIIKVGELEIAEMVQQITDAATKKLTSTAQILQFDKTSIREFYFPFN